MNPLNELKRLKAHFATLHDQKAKEPDPRSVPGQYHLQHETREDAKYRQAQHEAFGYAAAEVERAIRMCEPSSDPLPPLGIRVLVMNGETWEIAQRLDLGNGQWIWSFDCAASEDHAITKWQYLPACF